MSDGGESNPPGRRSNWLRWLMLALVTAFLLALVGLLLLPLQFVGLLLFGWVWYLRQVLPRMTFNPEIALDAALALGIGLFGLHGLLRWWAKHRRGASAIWRFGWTLKIGVMVLALFVISIVAVGLVEQGTWLVHEPAVVVDYRRLGGAVEVSNLKQLATAAQLYAADHGGRFPERLLDLAPQYVHWRGLFFSLAMEDNPPQPVLYYPGYNTKDPAGTIILASSYPSNSSGGQQRAIARLDTSAALIPEGQFQTLLQWQEVSRRKP